MRYADSESLRNPALRLYFTVVANAPRTISDYEMNMINLRRNFYTTLDFDEIKDRLKRKVGTNYKLGLINNEEISLYYLKDRYTENGLDRIPTCKIEIKNEKQENGRIRIKFAIAEFSFVLVGLIPVVFMLILYFAKAPIPFYYALGLYPILYFVLVFILTDQSGKFKTDLEELENGKNKLE